MDSQPRIGRSLRGFASMSKDRQREIASRGGRAAHERGTAHEFNSSEASLAARIGHQRGTAHEFTADEARQAGRKGGLARARNRGGSNGSQELVGATASDSSVESNMEPVGAMN